MIQKISLPVAGALFLVLGAGILLFLALSRTEKENPSLFGIRLTPPAFAQGAPTDFPDPNAGLSAYVQLNQPMNLDDLANDVFNRVFFVGDNYVVGNVITHSSSQANGASPVAIDVRVYADEDGLLVAYFPAGTRNALLFDWDEWDRANPVIKTTFQEAMEAVAQAGAGTSTAEIPLSWYHWAHPTATHLLATAKSVTASTENLFLSVPSGVTILDTPSYSYRFGRTFSISGSITIRLIVQNSDGEVVVDSSAFSGDLPLDPDVMYTLKNSRTGFFTDVGVAIVYRAE